MQNRGPEWGICKEQSMLAKPVLHDKAKWRPHVKLVGASGKWATMAADH